MAMMKNKFSSVPDPVSGEVDALSLTPIPFSAAGIDDAECDLVDQVLRSGWITTGPKCTEFEKAIGEYLGAKHVVAVSSCSAALHLSLLAAGIGTGDEVITSPLTFAATVNSILHTGARPVLCDISAATGNIDPAQIERHISPRTRAIIPVHYAGQACDMAEIIEIADRHGIMIIEDAAQAIGAEYMGQKVGADSRAACFSFHPVKNMTTIEGGVIATNNAELADQARRLSFHGISKNAYQRYSRQGGWQYEVTAAGFKYNMTDIQAAVGLAQLAKLDGFVQARQERAAWYQSLLGDVSEIILPRVASDRTHTWQLFFIRLADHAAIERDELIERLKEQGISVNVHYIPITHHRFYQERLGVSIDDYPVTRDVYRRLVTLPLYPKISHQDVQRVSDAIRSLVTA